MRVGALLFDGITIAEQWGVVGTRREEVLPVSELPVHRSSHERVEHLEELRAVASNVHRPLGAQAVFEGYARYGRDRSGRQPHMGNGDCSTVIQTLRGTDWAAVDEALPAGTYFVRGFGQRHTDDTTVHGVDPSETWMTASDRC